MTIVGNPDYSLILWNRNTCIFCYLVVIKGTIDTSYLLQIALPTVYQCCERKICLLLPMVSVPLKCFERDKSLNRNSPLAKTSLSLHTCCRISKLCGTSQTNALVVCNGYETNYFIRVCSEVEQKVTQATSPFSNYVNHAHHFNSSYVAVLRI